MELQLKDTWRRDRNRAEVSSARESEAGETGEITGKVVGKL